MISIIISSINPSLLKQLSDNIDKTIGVEYEIITHNNYETNWGICKVYNHCAKKAKYDYLVFCHEDILFHTQNWGKKLVELLKNKEIALVGVAGSTFKSKHPAPWISVPKKFYRTNAMSNINDKQKKHINNPDNNEKYSQVVILDGYFLSTTKENWKKNKFDENKITGFHYYDIDYSLKQQKKVVVTHKILIEHFSKGNFDKNWLKTSIQYHKKHKTTLFLDNLYKNEVKKIENNISRKFFLLLLQKQYNWFYTLFYLNKIIFSNFFNKNNLRLIIKFLSNTIKRVLNSIYKFYLFIGKNTINTYLKSKYNKKDFCIISSNCWAGHLYQALGKKYNTPFVGLFINAEDYINLLSNFDYLMKQELKIKLKSKYKSLHIYYPIGVLPGDIEIHFMHYKSEAEALEKWNKRKNRMIKDKNQIFVKFDDRDFCEDYHIEKFHKLNFKNKISFTKKKYNFTENIKLKNSKDLILLYSTVGLFDIPKWLNTGKITNSFINKLITKLFPYPKSWTH